MPFCLLYVFYVLQDQLVYMKGLILKHVREPMTRDQVRSYHSSPH